MITFFTTGKPFTGHNGVIQRNALKSWTLADPDAEVILFGDEEGAAETARDLGIRHVAEVEHAPEGPKVLRSFFDAAQRMARHDVMCYANCDIVLMEDLGAAVRNVAATGKEFLIVGRRWDTDVMGPITFEEAGWKAKLRERARGKGNQRSGGWSAYFVFRRGFEREKV